jgi:hypothetical protein
MKYFGYILLALFLSSCAAGNYQPGEVGPVGENVVVKQGENEEEYDIIIDDPGFSRWMTTQARPADFYSLQYYENKNQVYVSRWNDLVYSTGTHPNSPFTNIINYDTGVDYGLRVNYLLFNYFRYIESLYGNYFNFPT